MPGFDYLMDFILFDTGHGGGDVWNPYAQINILSGKGKTDRKSWTATAQSEFHRSYSLDDLLIPRHFQRLITGELTRVDPGRPG